LRKSLANFFPSRDFNNQPSASHLTPSLRLSIHIISSRDLILHDRRAFLFHLHLSIRVDSLTPTPPPRRVFSSTTSPCLTTNSMATRHRPGLTHPRKKANGQGRKSSIQPTFVLLKAKRRQQYSRAFLCKGALHPHFCFITDRSQLHQLAHWQDHCWQQSAPRSQFPAQREDAMSIRLPR
jgi:hypothetical protein